MNCPKCDHKVRVIDTTTNFVDNEIYRIRKCPSCGHTYYTIEFEADMDDQFKKNWVKYNRSSVRYRNISNPENN